MDPNEDKKQVITQAALKRFAHFGIGKTTLQDIADDAGLSKANVYYYFADKEAIIESAIENVVQEFKSEIQQKAQNLDCSVNGFQAFLKVRKTFLDKYSFLYSSDLSELSNAPKRFSKYAKVLTDFEGQYILNLFESGLNNQEFVTIDPKKTSEIYLEAIRGIACITQVCATDNMHFNKSKINDIHQKQLHLTHIFLSGISNNKIENNLFL